MKKRLAAVTTVLAMLVALFPTYGVETYAAGSDDLKVEYHSIEQIKDFASRYPASLDQTVTYAQEPSVKSPYSAGKISDETAKSALNLVNQIRYIAGVPAVVTLGNNYAEKAQAAALLNAANNELSHYPEKPSDMSDDLFALGKTGALSSNLAWNYGTLNKAILDGWMYDSNSSNISTVGHRNWVLNPTMRKTGFGVADRFFSMYIYDGVQNTSSYKNVAWPAQNTPVEYFSNNQAWSITTGLTLDKSKINVTLKRNSDGIVWNFSEEKSDGEFYVSNDTYGMKGCIIFRPAQIVINSGDIFNVKITGAGDDIAYTVNFFTLGSVTDSSDTTNSSTSVSSSTSDSTSSSGTTSDAEMQYIEITGTNVNARAGAGTNYKFITTVNKGQRYKFTATKTVDGNKWYKISVNGKTCWVIGTYVKEVDSAVTTTAASSSTTPAAGNYVEITGDAVNVRAGAGTNYKVITNVKQGQRYKFTSTKTVDGDKWYKIKLNDKEGWIIGTYVKEVDSAVTTTAASSTTTASSQSTENTSGSTTSSTAPAVKEYVEITGDAVNVRAGAGTNYKVITNVKQGQRYKFTSTKTVDGDVWYKIKLNDKEGWIIGTYVKEVDSGVTTTTTEMATTSTTASTSASTTTTTKVTTAAPKTHIEITGKSVYVRAGAGTNHKIVSAVKRGEKYKFSATKTVNGVKWYKITVKGVTGWVIGTYAKEYSVTTTTKKTTTTTAAPKPYVVVTGSAVNVRTGAGTNYTVITSVKKGVKLDYTSVKTVNGTKWYKVTVGDKTGWVVGTYVNAVTPTTKKTTTTTKKVTYSYIVITGRSVYVRAGAGTNYKIVSAVKRGERYKFAATKTVNGVKWYKITVKGRTGWVIGTYAKLSQ